MLFFVQFCEFWRTDVAVLSSVLSDINRLRYTHRQTETGTDHSPKDAIANRRMVCHGCDNWHGHQAIKTINTDFALTRAGRMP